MTLGGASVLVWKPDGLVDESSLMSLDNEQGFEVMKEEMWNCIGLPEEFLLRVVVS